MGWDEGGERMSGYELKRFLGSAVIQALAWITASHRGLQCCGRKEGGGIEIYLAVNSSGL